MELPDRTHAKSWEGLEVLDLSGQPLGTCVGIFADTDTEIVEWLLVAVTGHDRSFVPAVDSVEEDGRVRLPFPRELVLTAPDVGDAQQLAKSDEIALYRHYDVPYTDDASDSLLPDEVTLAGDDDDVQDVSVPPLVAPEPLGAAGTAAVVDPVADPLLDPAAGPLVDPLVDPLVVPTPVPAPPVAVEEPPARDEDEPVLARVQPEVQQEVQQEVGVEDVEAGSAPPDGGREQDVLAAVAPLAAISAGVAAVWLVLRALDRRAARRRSLPARTRHLRSRTAAAAGAAASSARSDAERRRRRAAEIAQQQRKAAAKKRKAAAKQRAAARKAAVEQRAQARQSLTAATSAVSERTSHAVEAVTAVPGAAAGSVADAARSVRRSTASLLWDAATASAAAAGYVLGARAGRERYEQITDVAAAAAARPEVQTAKQALTDEDEERRAEAVRSLKEQGQQLLSRVLPG